MDTGNTMSDNFVVAMLTVQPRGYGEHSKRILSGDFPDGSAPWIRGTPH